MRLLGDGAPFVSGIDAPELNGKCPAERMLARLAKNRLQQLVSRPGVRVENSGKLDATSSRRPLVRVRLPNGRTAGSVLIEEGYAVTWHPDRVVNWCGRPRAMHRPIEVVQQIRDLTHQARAVKKNPAMAAG